MNSPWIKRCCWLLLLVVLIVLPARLAHGPAQASAATSARPPQAAPHAPAGRTVGWLAMTLAACTLAGLGLTRWRRRM